MSNSLRLVTILFFGLFISLLAAAEVADLIRDPTQPPPSSYVETTPIITDNKTIKIDGIFVSKNHSAVLIGNRVFTVGDKILDATITEITPQAVKLKNEDGEFNLLVPYSNVKSPIIKKKKESEKNEKSD